MDFIHDIHKRSCKNNTYVLVIIQYALKQFR